MFLCCDLCSLALLQWVQLDNLCDKILSLSTPATSG